MALERQVIEKKDFPIGRRGYDPDAVDAHLAAIANEVDQLKSSSRRRSETLASEASAQVRAIVEAAESSAAAITRQAEEDAADIRAEASQEAAATRQQASTQAREYVGQVSESTAVMLQRLDAMESELGALLESLRTGSNRLSADLQLLESNIDDVKTAVAPRPRFEPETPRYESPSRGGSVASASSAGSAAPSASVAADPAVLARTASVPAAAAEPLDGPVPAAEPAAESTAPVRRARVTSTAGDDDDVEGARLVALNMALNGTPRAETDRYLAENFALADRGGLLDEVYASVEG
ncbi:MAG TPA: DivIVA domain-containing protein [Solirubrobacteraceae bacterium]|nr:DivIVA domain-containing protein [Solirubrobacteraceae bacterium]